MPNTFRVPRDGLRHSFLLALAADLRTLGHGASVRSNKDYFALVFDARQFDGRTPDQLRQVYGRLQWRNLRDERSRLVALEKSGILNHFANGSDVDPARIRLEIVFPSAPLERDLFFYSRATQNVPNSDGVGRRVQALLFDVGQRKRYLFGLLGLASPMYSQGARDRWFGWSNIDSRSKQKQVKEFALRRMMQMQVCMAIPPYNHILGGKLVALSAFSDAIQREYRNKYGDPLLAAITSSVQSTRPAHCTRIRLRRIDHPGHRTRRTELFSRADSNPSVMYSALSSKSVEIARLLVAPDSLFPQRTQERMSHRESRVNVIRSALRMCGISLGVLTTNPKATYIGALEDAHLNALRVGNASDAEPVSLARAERYWIKEHALKVIESRTPAAAIRLARFRDSQSTEMSVTCRLRSAATNYFDE